ncbi:hypothetical protein [Tautonia plasticadhaerens]|uniref:DUF1440 domain-containing protein n=1 Tax=Tautonia plasticadhaerens TaxID=2527974 RepID=A0A518GXQ4_9BACT|nr:hypothetical protein [Tautonia plasticadhaerens]QDV33376.1 hypothetical protein ElP_12470 [Tautonia plasticadhaerens]
MTTRRLSRGPMTGLFLGSAGAVAGLVAMRLYWDYAAPIVKRGPTSPPPSRKTQAEQGPGHPLDDISLVGTRHQGDESSTSALGRIGFEQITGRTPDDRTKTRLSFGVHWGYGILMGGVYGLIRRRASFPDLVGGLLFSGGLWLFGDELMVPLLGLQGGPTAAGPAAHANRLGAHLAYGAATAAATQAMLAGLTRSPRTPGPTVPIGYDPIRDWRRSPSPREARRNHPRVGR